jgi:hypothetical protein
MKKSLIVVAMALGAHGAVAQTGIPMAHVGSRVEIMAGINLAKFDKGDPGSRAGLVAGLGLIKPKPSTSARCSAAVSRSST